MAKTPRKVHIVNAAGDLLFNRLTDDGGPLLRFQTYGFVAREDVDRNHVGSERIRGPWYIREGWV